MRAHPELLALFDRIALVGGREIAAAVQTFRAAGCPVVEEFTTASGWHMAQESAEGRERLKSYLVAANESIRALRIELALAKEPDPLRLQLRSALAAANERIKELEKRRTDSCDHCAASCASCGRTLHIDLRNAALEEAARSVETFMGFPRINASPLVAVIRALKKGGA